MRKLVVTASTAAMLAACATGIDGAQAQSSAAPAPAAPCVAAEQHQLDFWVGEWKVFNTADNIQYAVSTIESVVGGCAISEHYRSPKAPGGPYEGRSFSNYDAASGKWRQFYVDNTGRGTWYEGAADASGSVVLFADGAQAKQKMSYIPQTDGSVRQHGEFSTDDGKTWQTGYDYTYRRGE